MGKLLAWLKALFCRHSFQTLAVYDQDTIKAYCPKCRHKFVVNSAYKWKFKLDDTSEKDYENLRREIQIFRESYEKEK